MQKMNLKIRKLEEKTEDKSIKLLITLDLTVTAGIINGSAGAIKLNEVAATKVLELHNITSLYDLDNS